MEEQLEIKYTKEPGQEGSVATISKTIDLTQEELDVLNEILTLEISDTERLFNEQDIIELYPNHYLLKSIKEKLGGI